MTKYKFEKNVIDIILKTIKDNQEYLTQPENLPQLAKLGYMYNTLWYAGRLCWGYEGRILKSGQCEDNPKYKIENCDSKTPEIENLIYDAWGMHIDEEDPIDWNTFFTIVTEGKELSELDIALIKPNKTMYDWIYCLTHPDYRYVYEDSNYVIDNLLCVIGTGYGYKDGYIIKEASGADQDITVYGDWKNAKFRDDIKTIVDNILTIPELKNTIDTSYNVRKEWKDKKDADELAKDIKWFGMPFKEYEKLKGNSIPELLSKVTGKPYKEEKYKKHYPISDYSNISKFDKNTHKSYIEAAINICIEILDHKDDEEKCNVEFATKFMTSPFIRKEKLDNLNKK
jgi:hypothetical protein